MKRLLLSLVLLTGLGACSPRADEPRLPENVETFWEQFCDTPTSDTYLRFLHANRLAAMKHANPSDAVGVLHQVRAIEAQADQALRTADLLLADSVMTRVLELEEGEMLDSYDEVLPGARDRLRAASASVAGMLE